MVAEAVAKGRVIAPGFFYGPEYALHGVALNGMAHHKAN